MKVWNVSVPVVANVMEVDADEAYRRLANALRAAGFEPLDDLPSALTPPFEAEAGTEADL